MHLRGGSICVDAKSPAALGGLCVGLFNANADERPSGEEECISGERAPAGAAIQPISAPVLHEHGEGVELHTHIGPQL